MLQSACLGINPITFHNFAAQFNCTSIDLVSASLMVLIIIVLASEYFVGGLTYWGSSDDLLCIRFPAFLFGIPGISICQTTRCICSSRLFLFIVLNLIYLLFTVMIHLQQTSKH